MSGEQHDKGWFVAQLKPNARRIAQRNLERQHFVTFHPEELGTRRRNGRFAAARVPLFPGYLFVAFNAARGGWRAINSTPGITRLVSFGQSPAPVPAELIEGLRRRCSADGLLAEAPLPRPGDDVRLTSGPFADFIARVERVTPERRIWVLLDLMGRATRAEALPEQMRAV